jgi:dTDP-4-amino-4,6-dideoxygalactose transaminase
MAVPLIDLSAQHAPLRSELDAAFGRVIDSSAFVNGPEVAAFEDEFAEFCEVRHAVGVGNGTDALVLALRAVGVGPGDEVVTVPFTFAATAEAICHVGARPVFTDIDPRTFNMDPAALQRTLDRHRNVRAVVPVHLYGQPAAMDAISELTRVAGAALIEDSAQAHGARYRGRRVGALGDAACFSFYPAKNLGALGDGGAVTSADDDVAARLRLLRDHGQGRKYEHDHVGFNSRLDALQAAVLRVKLRHLEHWNARRRALAEAYGERLADVKGLALPGIAADCEHVFYLFVVRCAHRDSLQSFLRDRDIASAVHYPRPLHLQPAFAFLGYGAGDFPNAEQCASEVLALPLYPEMTDTALQQVSAAVREWADRHLP